MRVVLRSVFKEVTKHEEKPVDTTVDLPGCLMSTLAQPLIVGVDNFSNGWARVWYLSEVFPFEGNNEEFETVIEKGLTHNYHLNTIASLIHETTLGHMSLSDRYAIAQRILDSGYTKS